MSIVPTVVISNTAHGAANGEYDGSSTIWYTNKYKGDGYYGYTDGLHTASYKLTGFVGTIGFQATLATDPKDSDWFDVTESFGDTVTPVTDSVFVNFSGNFVWVRAVVTNFTAGTINRVIYN
jgi:hypothetical protein